MLKTVEGIYRNCQVELLEVPDDIHEARVIVIFLPPDWAAEKTDFAEAKTTENLADEQHRNS